MRIEKLELSDNKLKYIVIGVIITLLLVILINYLTSRANYRNTESIELAKGTINYSLVDLEIVSITIDGAPSDIMPGDGYVLKDTSYCTEKVGDTDTPSDTIKLTYENGILNITPYTTKGTKCYLEFEEALSNKMVAKLEERKGKQYEILPMPTIDSVASASQVSNTLYTTEDNYGTSYVFRGNVQDNWVTFANKRWRIIRINGDGTLRLIYQCGSASCTDTTGDNTQINGSKYIAYNDTYTDNTYVGYYNQNGTTSKYPDAHQGTNPSTIAAYINEWYSGAGAMTNYTKYLSGNTGFCNDRQIAQVSRINFKNTGYGGGSSNATAYITLDRFQDASWSWLGTQTPDLRCGVDPKTKTVDNAALQRDLYTTGDETGDGNGILTYPVGLITADEVVMAGGKGGINTTSYYLYTNKYYWTMSPFYFNNGYAYVFSVSDFGNFNINTAGGTSGVRPVINLRADTTFSGGNGLVGSPFVVKTD